MGKDQSDIRNFFTKKNDVESNDDKKIDTCKTGTGGGGGSKKRTLVITESSDDEVVVEVIPTIEPLSKKKKLTPKKSDPVSFFKDRNTIQQKLNNTVKVVPKKDDFDDDFLMDGVFLGDDLLLLPDECETLTDFDDKVAQKEAEENDPGTEVKGDILGDDIMLVKNEQKGQKVTKTQKVLTDKNVEVSEKDTIQLAKVSPEKETIKKEKPLKAASAKTVTPVKENPASSTSGASKGVKEKSNTATSSSSKAAGYAKFLAKQAARTEIIRKERQLPVGAPNCLSGLTFVITGEFVSLDREAIQDIIKRYSGRVTGSVSGKTTYLLVGEQPGDSKLKKAAALRVKQMSEDEFYDFVNSFGGKADIETSAASSIKEPLEQKSSASKGVNSESKGKGVLSPAGDWKGKSDRPPGDQMWTEKYKPTSYDQVIGNTVLVQKLAAWLKKWPKNRREGFPKGSSKDGDDSFRAALLSGSPGLGKTTAAHLVAKMEGFEVIEFNASDVRSKSALQKIVKEATTNRTITDLFNEKKGRLKVIIMDEVDGMSAGDRGGVAELILLIKKTSTPIICICNDHASPKVRSLANYCLPLKFKKPAANQVEKRVQMIAAKEHLTLQPNVVQELVAMTMGDIRQILNLLSTYRLGANNLSYDQTKTLSHTAGKNFTMSPFDICGKLLQQSSFRSASFDQKMDLFFQDFSLIPLMIQENYIKMNPSLAQNVPPRGVSAEKMALLSKAADSISDADIIDSGSRAENSWNLLPVLGVISTIKPCFFMHGALVQSGRGYTGYSFPSWLGQNSTQSKSKRVSRELQTHMRLKTSADKEQIVLGYLPLIATVLTKPLIEKEADGIEEVIARMDYYFLDREDRDSIMGLGYNKEFEKISSKTKAAFTRGYNKTSHPNPFLDSSSKGSKREHNSTEIPDCEEVILDEVIDEEDEEELPEKVKESQTKVKAGASSAGKAKAKPKTKGKSVKK